jgi:cob(I)alamin adenosyltransferase
MKQGLVYVFTGEGKGKTSAALGTAMRAVGAGMRVAWVAWYKQPGWKLSEIVSLEKLGVKVYLMGKGFHIGSRESGVGSRVKTVKTAKVGVNGMVADTASEEEHRQAAQEALKKAGSLVGKVDVLVLDEVNNALADRLIDLIGLIDLISKRGKTHLILTGRNVRSEIIGMADVVSEMKKIKHVYNKGTLAIRGLDF